MSWTIFTDKGLPSQLNPFDCANTVHSTCYKTSFDKCLSLCQSSPRCNYGHYRSSGECFPLITTNYPDLNPYDYMADFTPDKNDENDRVFINNKIYQKFSNSNNVRYYDYINLKNVETNTFLQVGLIEDEFAKFAPFPSDLTIEYKNVNIPRSAVRYGDELTFGVPRHPVILTRGLAKVFPPSFGFVSWNNITPYGMLQISLFKPEKLENNNDKSPINFGDNFHLKIIGSYLTVDDEMNAKVEYLSPQALISKSKNCTFQILPSKDVTGYYCDGKLCKSVSFQDTDSNGNNRFYKNNEVYRTDSCFFKC